MAKRKRPSFQQSTGSPLIVVAGLPFPICARVANSIKQAHTPKPRVVYEPSGQTSKELYPARTVATLLRAVIESCSRQITPPQHILLAYIPSPDDEELLSAFDFFVFPVRLNFLAEYDQNGRQNRHSQAICEQYTRELISTIGPQFMEVKQRLSKPTDKEPLFLPPRNFQISAEECVADRFKALARQKLSWSDPMIDIKRIEVTRTELPKHVGSQGRKTVLADVRGLLFPHDPSEHGMPRDVENNTTDFKRKGTMRALFRFGVPLRAGYHHDAQFPNRKLAGVLFECGEQGRIHLHCSYSNVYPNDYVRPSKT